MTTIMILGCSYQLPALPVSIKELSGSIEKRIAIIETGEEPKAPWLGFLPGRARQCSIEERFAQVDELVKDYQSLLECLQSHLDSCRSFFKDLGKGLQSALAAKAEKIRVLEHKRRSIAEAVGQSGEEIVRSRMEELYERLLHIVRIVGEATLLILRRMDLFWEAMPGLVEHINRALGALEGLKLERQVDQLEAGIREVTRQAGDLKDYFRGYFTPLEAVLDQVDLMDEKLKTTVDEIGKVALFLELEKGDLPALGPDALILDFLIRSQLKTDQLMAALQHAFLIDGTAEELDLRMVIVGEATIEDALNNIIAYSQLRFEKSFGRELLERARKEDSPDTWGAYLAEFPNGVAGEEARQALAQLDARELERARAEETSDTWHYYLVNFAARHVPSDKNRQEAHEGILRSQARERRAVKEWREYLRSYPNGSAVEEARLFLKELEWVPHWASAYGEDDLPNGARWADLTIKNVTQRFRLIEPGTFLMGSPSDEPGHEERELQHEVTLTKPFWIAETECTQALWQAVMNNNPSHFRSDDRPVEMVSWNDCQEFLRALNHLAPDLDATLPTEAQWEYTCRANTSGPFANATNPREIGWFSDNSGGETKPVKQLKPNSWGLYDMLGNVQEWCLDGLRTYTSEKAIDPIGPVSGAAVCRGGCWDWGWGAMRSAVRPHHGFEDRWHARGFRIVAPAVLKIENPIDILARTFEKGIFLGDLKPFQIQTDDKNQVHINEAFGMFSLMVGAKRCSIFLCLFAPATVEWVIPTGARKFTAVGTCPDHPSAMLRRSFAFQILVDDKMVFISQPSYEERGGIPIDIALPPNARRLTVRVDHLGDVTNDASVLAWPYFHGDFTDSTEQEAPIRAAVEDLSKKLGNSIFLGDLQPLSLNVWRFMVNQDWHNNSTICVGEKPCGNFLFTLAPAELNYAIPAGARRFTAVGGHTRSLRAPQGSWKYQVLIDGDMVFESSPLYNYLEGLPIDVSIPPNSKKLTLLVDDLEKNNTSDEAVWAWPYFHIDLDAHLEELCKKPEAGIFLGDLEPLKVEVVHGIFTVNKVGWDTGNIAEGVAVAGSKPCRTYLWLHSPASVVYAIPEGVTRFTAIGARLDNQTSLHGSWKYRVFIDDKPVFDSPPLHEFPKGIPIDVVVPSGAKRLSITVDDFGDSYGDHSLLAYPYFHFGDKKITLDQKEIFPNEGYAFIFQGPGIYITRADTNEDPKISELILLEDGKPLGPAHSLHSEIRLNGQGRYSHWSDGNKFCLYFSSSDNSDPRNNKKVYQILIP
jgi:formylglycine-generating enzyme